MDNDKKFYLKISLILAVAFFIWFFSSPEGKVVTSDGSGQVFPLKDKPAALQNFVLPALVVFKDSGDVLPKRNWQVPFLELQADAALAMNSDGSRIYFNKNIEKKRPIASLTKLMTAVVVLENYDLNQIVNVSHGAVQREGVMGNLSAGESLSVRSLLNIMLIDSSNDAAFALSEQKTDFVFLMNEKAGELKLSNTHFSNSDGLDDPSNYSSALDIAKIFSYLKINHSQAFEILKTKNMVVYSSDGKIEHRLKNTNELLGALDGVVAGKTGYTGEAGGSLALLVSDLSLGKKDEIITVVLNSPDRFGESEKLIKWLKEAFIWN